MKTNHPKISQSEVLAWLQQNHPHLHAQAALDRSWVWLPVNLQGDTHKAVRASIKSFGFRYAKRGHPLNNGKVGTWAHSGTHPIPFIRNKNKVKPKSEQSQQQSQSEDKVDDAIAQALAELGI